MRLFWHVIEFLLLRDNKNILPWLNILIDVHNKNLVLQERLFCVETKCLTLHKKSSDVDKNKLILNEKVFHVSNKKLMLH